MALDQTVRAEVVKNIIKYEKKINHFYLDSLGKVTVGIGHLIPNKQLVSMVTMYKVVNKLPGQMATSQDKQKEYDTIAKQKIGYKAEWYAKHTTLTMKDADCTALLNKHVASFYKELTNLYKKSNGYPDDFDKLDKNIQMALFDMIFNLGANRVVAKFPLFDKALKAGDWKKAATESNRPQLDPLRNTYVRNKLLAAVKKPIGVTP